MCTRDSYDTVAVNYQQLVAGELPEKVFDRAMLAAFAELVHAGSGGPVADIGCGPGHVTAHLASLGLDAFGLDLSPEMVGLARAAYPNLRFEVESMTALSLSSESLSGIVARYSTIHLPETELPVAFAEFRRVLVPGGYLLLDFQVGDGRVDRTEAYGHAVSLTNFFRPVATVASALVLAGFEAVAQLTRAPDSREKMDQCHLIYRSS